MVQSGTFLQTVDNSGVKELKCIRILAGSKKKIGVLGDIISASVKEVRVRKIKKASLKKGDVVFALIIQTTSVKRRFDGQELTFLKNSAIILDKQHKIIGSRIGSPAYKEFRKKKFLKFASLSSKLI